MRAAWGSDLLLRLFAVCVCVWVCVCDRMHAMHAITGCPGEIVRSRPRCTPLPPCSDAPGRGAVRCLIWEAAATLETFRMRLDGAEHGSVTIPVVR
jgi:hypothetical protein